MLVIKLLSVAPEEEFFSFVICLCAKLTMKLSSVGKDDSFVAVNTAILKHYG